MTDRTCGTCHHYARSPQIGLGACMHGPLQCVITETGYMSVHPPVQHGQTCHQWRAAEQAAEQVNGQGGGRLLAG